MQHLGQKDPHSSVTVAVRVRPQVPMGRAGRLLLVSPKSLRCIQHAVAHEVVEQLTNIPVPQCAHTCGLTMPPHIGMVNIPL